MSQNKAKTGDKRSKHALKSLKTRGEIIDKWITNGSVAASFWVQFVNQIVIKLLCNLRQIGLLLLYRQGTVFM
jgi:hypothetical protein